MEQTKETPQKKDKPAKKLKSKKERKFYKKQKKNQENEEIKSVEERLAAEAPPRGVNPLTFFADDAKKAEEEGKEYNVFFPAATKFSELPISQKTQKGLANCKYVTMTEIQRASLPHVLCDRDLLGAAKTGSGKTLAFVIPILEKLWRLKWTKLDGIGAIVISPTRELALQTFEVLRKVGCAHDLSAGLIIGGKSLEHEKDRINRMNVLVCTPGRLLQHMDETIGFDCSNLQILVLDEADRILDMGFARALNAILENLPTTRQTLLFSATQTKSIRDLARLSLKDPEFVSVHEKAQTTTPIKLVQHVVFVDLHKKIDTLWNFIKSHLKNKMLIFMSSCKQVRYVYETFRRLRPGIPLTAIHGKLKQTKRMAIFFEFCKAKSACLFATDIAARGLDFPAVDWVVQLDCPEDVPTYIHRAGRTARYESGGCSLLFLLPSEKKMVDLLQEAKVPVKVIKINPTLQRYTIQNKLESLLSSDAELKYLAQKAFISYMRSVWLQSNKEVFNVQELPSAEFATSLGLIGAPKIRFIKGKKKDKNFVKQIESIPDNDDEAQGLVAPKKKKTHMEKLFSRKNTGVLSENFEKLREKEGTADDEDLLVVKKKHNVEDYEDEDDNDDDEDEESEDSGSEDDDIAIEDDSDEEMDEESVSQLKSLAKQKPKKANEAKKRKGSEMEEEKKSAKKLKPSASGKKVLSLEEQEKLALQLLNK